MSSSPEFLLLLVEIMLIYVTLRVGENFMRGHLRSKQDFMAIKVAYLENEIKEQALAHQKEIQSLKAEYDQKLYHAEEYSRYLMDEIQKLKVGSPSPTSHDRLLLVCAADSSSSICKEDENAVIRSKMPYTRLHNATIELLSQEIQRRRLAGDQFKYVQISGHASANGFVFANRTIDAYELATVIRGAQTVILAGCSDVSIADKLIGAVQSVISVREDVYSLDMANFTYSFWRAIVAGQSTKSAYEIARIEVPAVASFVDYREER